MQVGIGGSEANTAIALCRLGIPAAWIGCVGTDPLGDLVIRELTAEAIDLHVRRDDGSKQGEFEAFLERTDAGLFAQAKRVGGRSKPRAGAYFALNASPPPVVLSLYRQIVSRLKLAQSA